MLSTYICKHVGTEELYIEHTYPDSKVHGVNMGPTWVLSAPGGPRVGLIDLGIWVAK